jgi:hypothetical protein
VEIMNPNSPARALKERLIDQEVDFVLVNESLDKRKLLNYAEVDPIALMELKDRLAGKPGIFHEVYEGEDATIFAVDRNALLEWRPRDAAPPPYILPRGASPPGLQVGEIFDDKVELLSVDFPRHHVKAGEAFEVTCYWQSRVKKLEFDIPWVVQIRMQRDYPKGTFYSPAYSKLYRKVLELIKGEGYRRRWAHLPARGVIPPSLWGDFVIKDVAVIHVPRWIIPGTYELTVSISRQAVYPNLNISDLLRDDDQFSGVSVGSVVIE